jgi:hypothetical protein
MSYGKCPICGADVVSRERRPNGNSECVNGHTFPSRQTIDPGGGPDEDTARGPEAVALADRDRLAGWLDRIFAESRARGIAWPFRAAPGSSEWYEDRLEAARERERRMYREAVALLTPEQLAAIHAIGPGGLKREDDR